MPQILPLLAEKAWNYLNVFNLGDERLHRLGECLIRAVEKAWPIVKGDVAMSAPQTWRATINEADMQLQIHYTVGEDEYGAGDPFMPTLRKQKKLAKRLKKAVRRFFRKECVSPFSVSVWTRPHYGGHYFGPED